MEAAVASLTILRNDPLGEFVPSIPTTLGSAKLEVLHAKGGNTSAREHSKNPIELLAKGVA